MEQWLPGTQVYARGLGWEVVSTQSLGPQTLYRLRGTEGALMGSEIDLLHPFETIEPVILEFQPEKAAPLINWLVYHQAFLLEQSLGPGAILAVKPGRIELQPFQIVPVLRALKMSRVRLLLADGVGLGKTIQAGLILTELMARKIAHRVLIVSPAGPLLQQWNLEMQERFGLRFDIVDRGRLDEIQKGAELGANPFDFIPLGLISMDFLKQERVLEYLERTNYDIVVMDEAHHYMILGATQDREDSLRRRLADVLARQSDALLLLTATPHDGNDRSFASLCELLDPSLVDGRGNLRGQRYREHVVRRLKNHLKDLFKQRIVQPCPVIVAPETNADFYRFNKALLDLIAPELKRAFRNQSYQDVLSFISLLKRSVSTVRASYSTLQVIRDRIQVLLNERTETQENRKQRLRALKDYNRKTDRFGAISAEEEEEKYLLEAEDVAQQLLLLQREIRSDSRQANKSADLIQALEHLISLAEQSLGQDPKLYQILAEVQTVRKAEPKANILVYTEYTDSLKAVADFLSAADVGEIITISGNDPDKERIKKTERFRNQEPLILVSTDASAEGLNLHKRCHHLIHLELPFNPNRLEQRNGRIDRYGQEQNPMVRYLYLCGTFEENILLRLIAKYEKQRERLTFVPNTLGLTASSDAANQRLLKGLMDEDTRLFNQEGTLFDFHSPDENEGSEEAVREILEEIDRSLSQYRKATQAHQWLGEAGLHAEASQIKEAESARETGLKVGVDNLAQFVADAVMLAGGDGPGEIRGDIFELVLPSSWCSGLEDLPGYDSDSRIFRLTTQVQITSDSNGRFVGYIGRTHPLVRRALERVRNLSFGDNAQRGQDIRISAVEGPVPSPTLLITFLGRVSSRAGREFEQVCAVKITEHNEAEFMLEPNQWLALADRRKAINTTDIWKNRFSSWGNQPRIDAQCVAQDGFQPIAIAAITKIQSMLQEEKRHQQEWLTMRAAEVTHVSTPQSIQESFLDSEDNSTSSASSWVSLSSPWERLTAFCGEPSQSSSRRHEAEGVLRIYKQRMEELESRLDMGEPEVVPLGMLMIVPEGHHGA